MCVCLLCRKLCSYRVLQWSFVQGEPFGWTPLLGCSVMDVVPSLCYVGVFGMFAVMKCKRLFSSVFAITERRDMGLYDLPLSMYLFGFGMGTMLANFHMCGIMLMLRVVFNMRNACPRVPMCFRCLMFSLSGPCELLFLLCFIASWTWVVVSVMLYPCIVCVALLIDMLVLCVSYLTMFVNC